MKYENLDYLNRPYGRTRAGEFIRTVARSLLDKATERAQPKRTEPVEVTPQRFLPPTGLVKIIPGPDEQVPIQQEVIAAGESALSQAPEQLPKPEIPPRHLRIVR